MSLIPRRRPRRRVILLGITPALILSTSAMAGPPVAAEDPTERRDLCARSIVLSGLEQEMDANIREIVDSAFVALMIANPEDEKTVGAYRDSLAEAMTEAKAPVLTRLQESCVAAFTIAELKGINTFYASDAGRAWIEKGRTLMRPALDKAVADAVPGLIAETQRRFCERLGGCAAAPDIQPTTKSLKKEPVSVPQP